MTDNAPAQDTPDNPQELRKWRRGIYIGLAVATAAYVLCAVRVMRIGPAGDGFEAIPLFLATLLYFLLALPALPIAVIATQLGTIRLGAMMLWMAALLVLLLAFAV